MRLTVWKLAMPLGAVLGTGCVEETAEPAPGSILENNDGGARAGDDWVFDASPGGGSAPKGDASLNPRDPGSNDDAGAGDGGTNGAPVGSLSCQTYCQENLRVCTGENRQYDSLEQCLNMCADTDLGEENDASGDTAGCRLYHTRLAEMTGDYAQHCRHAGPTGGSVCGQRCEVLCDRAMKLCSEERGYVQSSVYRDEEQCLTLCKPGANGQGGYAVDRENEHPASGDTVNCRLYHLRIAYTDLDRDTGTPIQHCDHVRQVSTTCRDL